MFKLISVLSACFLIFISCGKPVNNLDFSTPLPDCIQEFINDNNFSDPLKTVKSQELNGEFHYWMNTGATHFDGVEYILNKNCEEVSFFCGECFPPDCSYEYDSEKWKIVWEN